MPYCFVAAHGLRNTDLAKTALVSFYGLPLLLVPQWAESKYCFKIDICENWNSLFFRPVKNKLLLKCLLRLCQTEWWFPVVFYVSLAFMLHLFSLAFVTCLIPFKWAGHSLPFSSFPITYFSPSLNRFHTSPAPSLYLFCLEQKLPLLLHFVMCNIVQSTEIAG